MTAVIPTVMPTSLSTAFFYTVRTQLFHGKLTQSQVDGMTALHAASLLCTGLIPDQLAYFMATAYHETNQTMQPIREIGQGRGHPYGLPAGPYQLCYYGRDFVQTTWYANYLKLEQMTGLPLTKNPDLLLDPKNSALADIKAMMAGMYTTRKLSTYVNATMVDFVNARRVINGTDCANAIAVYANIFSGALKT